MGTETPSRTSSPSRSPTIPGRNLRRKWPCHQLAPNEAKLWIRRLVKQLDRNRTAIVAAGAFADPEGIPLLLDQMKDPELARVAGEAFCLVTGADLRRDKLRAEKPEGLESGPTDNPEDENVAMDPDENLDWPDPELVRRSWADRQGSFAKGTRYLLGRPITPESLRLVLKEGYQRQRPRRHWNWPSSGPAVPSSRSAPRASGSRPCCDTAARPKSPRTSIPDATLPSKFRQEGSKHFLASVV